MLDCIRNMGTSGFTQYLDTVKITLKTLINREKSMLIIFLPVGCSYANIFLGMLALWIPSQTIFWCLVAIEFKPCCWICTWPWGISAPKKKMVWRSEKDKVKRTILAGLWGPNTSAALLLNTQEQANNQVDTHTRLAEPQVLKPQTAGT